MNNSPQMIRNGEMLSLQGRINFQTVPGLYKLFNLELVPGINTLDCSKVEQCDSSAISLLLAGLRLAHQQHIHLQIQGMNEQLLSLARLYEVEALLQPVPDPAVR
jgi:ABC-type transporter Mla MlaB component